MRPRRTRSISVAALVAGGVLACAGPAAAAGPAEHPIGVPATVTPYQVGHGPSPMLRARSSTTTSGPMPCTGNGTISAAQAQYGFGYLANQVAQAYNLTPYYGQGDEGQGQTIAVLELEPDRATDIDAYQGCYGTNASVNYTAIDGGVNGTGTDTTDPGSGEAALDIEQIIGLAPRATIDVYQAPNTVTGVLDAYQAMVSDPATTIISTSWGACETGNPLAPLEKAIFANAAQDGISVFAAAGDNGSTDCGTSAPAVDDPASDPYVTGVGGTTLPNLTNPSQQFAWNGSAISNGATGGGFSSLWNEPTWQQSATVTAQGAAASAGELACPGAATGGYCRAVPDVSANADPYTGYIIYLTQNVTDPSTGTTSEQLTAVPWGGTSAAAPLWAAATALINASPDCNGHNLGFLNPLLYQASVTGMPGLTDITVGNNDNSVDNPTAFFTTARGYDPVTGLGTPVAGALGKSLCAVADTLTLSTPGAQASSYGQPVSLSGVSATDTQGHALTYTASGLPAGLTIDASTGTISGTPTANANTTVRVTVTAADNGATKTSLIPWTVTGGPDPTTTTATTTTNPTAPPPGGGSGQEQQGGTVATQATTRTLHITRRYRGHTVRITLTITTKGTQSHLLVSYIDKPGRSRQRLQLVQLEERPQAQAGRRPLRTARAVVLAHTRRASGRINVNLTPSRAARGLQINLNYTGGAILVRLPGL